MKKSMFAATAAVLLTGGAALFGVYPALAQSGTDPMGKGTVTWAEAKAQADRLWTRLDVNKDGVLNAADSEARMAEMFGDMDTNHDGAISRAEFTEHHKAMMAGKGKMDGPPMDMRRMGMDMPHGGRKLREMAELADTNHDQSISRAEFDAAAKARFDKADANRDGQLTAAERRAAWVGERKHKSRTGGRHGGHGMQGTMGGDRDDMPPPPPPPGA